MTHTTPAAEATHAPHRHYHPPVGHAVPFGVLVTVLLSLLVLTFLTVVATWFDFGSWNTWIAIGIATVKAMLVALFFMHLAYDRPFNAIVLLTTLLFVTLFLGLALLDAFSYRESVDSYRQANPDMVAPDMTSGRSAVQPSP
jgi:cytochrome c oxidase subunit 4